MLIGLTLVPFKIVDKCTCGTVSLAEPVFPFNPITVLELTLSPTFTFNLFKCA
jgi:hypothetical protein